MGVFAGLSPDARAQTSQVVYADSLQNGWQNWSWATVNLSSTARVHSGSQAISVNAANWQALYLAAANSIDPAVFTNLSFWINGGATGGQIVHVQGTVNSVGQTPVTLAPLPTNSWRQETISLAALGFAPGTPLDGIWFQIPTALTVPEFSVDDISFSGPGGAPATNVSPSVALVVDAAADRHPIDPRIYGVNFANSNDLRAMNVPLNRSGGNHTSRYNWRTNATSQAMDWFFQSLPQEGSGPGAWADGFVQQTKDGGAQPMLTIPINGWIAKLGPAGQRRCSFSIAKYGAQTGNDWQWFPDAGNGILAATGQPIVTNDPHDANQPATVDDQADWIRHLTNRWGGAANDGVRYYLMDNEWALWHDTHRDVHPVGVTMDQSRDLFCAYASMVKSNDLSALVLGPEEFGWSGYLYSGYDLQWGNTHGWGGALPDRAAHGGADMMPWWLNQVRLRSEAQGRRLLDVFTLHYYPQGGEFSDTVSAAMQARRNRSTRSLWDTNYLDESWMNDRIQLIPRMRAWVASNYPGTPIGITEYSWGADAHINGGTAQADVLGILGREGVDLATRWVSPASGTPAFRAYQIFRNYDGNGGAFGDTSVRALAPNPDQVAVFAAADSSSGALTVILINKEAASAPATLAISNFAHGGTAQLWQMTSGAPIARLSDLPVSSNLACTLPPQSVTLAVIPPAPASQPGARYPADLFHSPITAEVASHLQAILANGPARASNVFIKVGDSISAGGGILANFMGNFEYPYAQGGEYDWIGIKDLAGYESLIPALDHYLAAIAPVGGTATPFTRESLATQVGQSAAWALAGNPSPLQQEIDAMNPRYALIMYGANDVGGYGPMPPVVEQIVTNLMQIARICSDQGVVPVFTATPIRGGYEDATLTLSHLLRAACQVQRVPYLNCHRALMPLPAYGLQDDVIHPNSYSYNRSCVFWPQALLYGHNLRNLLTLQSLDRLYRLHAAGTYVPDTPVAAPSGSGLALDPWIVDPAYFADGHVVAGPFDHTYRFTTATALSYRAILARQGVQNSQISLLDGGGAVITQAAQSVEAPLAPGTYSVHITGALAAGATQGQYQVVIMPLDALAPAAPSGLTLADVDGKDCLAWNPATDDGEVVGYRIYRNDTQVGYAYGTCWPDTELEAGTNLYSVSAVDAMGREGPRSAPWDGILRVSFGVPVAWLHGFDITNALEDAILQDPDLDGIPTWQEYYMDTDPTNLASHLVFNRDTRLDASGRILAWPASSNRLYTILWGDDLYKGITNPLLQNIRPPTNGTARYTDTNPFAPPAIYYRLQVTLP